MRVWRFVRRVGVAVGVAVLLGFLYFQSLKTDPKEILLKQEGNVEEDGEWERELTLDKEEGRVRILWNFTKDEITMLVIGRTTGYVGVGFSHSTGMADSDIIIGWVKNGQVQLKDLYGVRNGLPLEDPRQDYELLFGGENETHTWFCFRRKLDTDDENDIKITMSTFHVLWAIHEEDVSDSGLTDHLYHGAQRGMHKVLFLYLIPKPPPMTPDIEAFDLRLNNRRIPEYSVNKTYIYWCQLVKIPNFGEMHHMIGYEGLMNNRSTRVLHHILVYYCAPGVAFKEQFEKVLSYECVTNHMFIDLMCRKRIAGIGINGKRSFLPPKVGLPFGSSQDDTMYLMIELHYNLENQLHAFYDNSGMRLYHTKKLRPHSVGPLDIATRFFYVIPPKAVDFPTYSMCTPKCTKALFPKGGINIVALYMHAHHFVKSVTLYHYRNNQQINRISEEYFDYEFQTPRVLKEEIKVLQNDTLVFECLHDTTAIEKPIFSGISASHDMCLLMFLVYPTLPFGLCLSGLVPSEMHNLFNEIPDLSMGKPSWASFALQVYHSAGASYYAMERNWTQSKINTFTEAVKYGQYSSHCRGDDLSSQIVEDVSRLPNISWPIK